MELMVKERLLLPSILPNESDIVTQLLSRDVRKKVELTSADMEELHVKSDYRTGVMSWDECAAKEKVLNVTFTEAEANLLRGCIDRLDREKKITRDLLDLALKIRDGK